MSGVCERSKPWTKKDEARNRTSASNPLGSSVAWIGKSVGSPGDRGQPGLSFPLYGYNPGG